MRYRFDWNCKEWREFSARDAVEPVSNSEWWEEYSKYHRFFDDECEFLERVGDILKTIYPDDRKALAEMYGAIWLLRAGKVKRIQFDDLELSVWEDAK